MEAIQGSFPHPTWSPRVVGTGNLVSHEPANKEQWMTNSCWNFFPVFINLCIDIILIKIILTAPVKKLWGLQEQLNVLSKMISSLVSQEGN